MSLCYTCKHIIIPAGCQGKRADLWWLTCLNLSFSCSVSDLGDVINLLRLWILWPVFDLDWCFRTDVLCLVSSLCIRFYVLILWMFLDWCVECLACSLLAGWMLWWQDKSPTEYSSRPGVEISGARLPGPHSARVTAPGPWSPLTTSHRGEMAHEQGWIIFSNVDEI